MGYSYATKKQVLRPSTVKVGCKDWLSLKSVAKRPLKGWHDDESSSGRGWAPLGITEGEQIYMGGLGCWSANLRNGTVVVTFPNTSWDTSKYKEYKDEVDDIDGVTQQAVIDFRAS